MTKTVYFGAGWFTPAQKKSYKIAMESLKINISVDLEHSYVPLEHQYKNIRVDEHPEYLHDKEWAIATFNGDIVGIKSSDVALFTYLPLQEDIGCGVELGYAKAINKFIVVAIPDEEWGKPINLMSFGAADIFIKLSDLKKYDFTKPSFNYYEGAVY
ncbi:nucleoside 2-deoxyribosyltransferase [Liquorilactobacillus hordei]|uniref:Nucleoside deoxyribosyltransferase n=1 Tax=Liquorilactobacillus hordei DSM 19519 TaxID=1423759 RepID=A0A0R1MJG2_9LACO|nr:nucleoside 2-deoxyribosyltransferase [Liquorilactobacillus hordei]KRL08096.1 Nucleoside deoxyribosyltransferase [Liquorilactobacillus hordei DSM 19519]QYH51823.1 nucleoside 2-deoxyribosyltransferase [Liquorilactobacillus hordei DSM 19519]